MRNRLLVCALLLLLAAPPLAAAQTAPTSPTGTYGFGRPATPDDLKPIDIDVRADGAGLPAGSGTATQGGPIFATKCAACHGSSGEGTPAAPRLVDSTPFQSGVTAPTIGNYWPYATTVWDYINRAMPFDRPGSLTSDEVYALTAFLLSANQIVSDSDVMDATSLPKVRMPNAQGFTAPDPRPDAP
jgi:cytochrome c